MGVEQAVLDIGILLALALAGGVIAKRFNQPSAIGMLLAGMAFGPNVLNVLQNAEILTFSIEVGATLLLFVIGLEFNLRKLKKVWVQSLLIALLKFGTVVFLAYEASAFFLQLEPVQALMIGLLIAFTSTVVVVKILQEKGMIERDEIPTLLGILIFEDLFGVVLLTVFTNIQGSGMAGILLNLSSLVLALVFLVGLYVIGLLTLRPLVKFIQVQIYNLYK